MFMPMIGHLEPDKIRLWEYYNQNWRNQVYNHIQTPNLTIPDCFCI